MVIAEVETSREPVMLSNAAMVAVTLAGITLPRFTSADPYPLQLRDLMLLDALGRGPDRPLDETVDQVAIRCGSDRAAFDGLLDALATRHLLTPVGAVEPSEDLPPIRPEPIPDDEKLVLTPAIVWRTCSGGFEHRDHDGDVDAVVDAQGLHASSQFRLPLTMDEGFEAHLREAGSLALERADFGALIAQLVARDVMQVFDPENPLHAGHTQNVEQLRNAIRRKHGVITALERDVAEHDDNEQQRQEQTGLTRTRIVPAVGVDNYWALPPLALGFLVSYAKAYEGGRLEDRYDFHPRWVTDRTKLEALAREPGIFLFSNYIWSHAENRQLSALVKAANPASVTIHGGPDTPKYEGDAERYFRDNPHVDITVRGEGEATFAEILDALGPLGSDPPDLRPLRDVRGLSFRMDGLAVHTPDRDRIAELDSIPSPYLTGLFDSFGNGLAEAMILETNRGCPYGCTFCDWGSATLSRIRKFDLDRVFAELEWCAKNQINTVSVADANYGVFARDIDIARKVAELKAEYGYPRLFATNYAKNTLKHLRPIIEVLAEAGIITEGKVSLQSMDTETLLTIRRSNIKVEKYNDLSDEFRKAKLPLTVDLMMGLPGATAASFRDDLQECVDREMPAIVHTTTLLPNSPMNEPSYREEHGIIASPGTVVDQTNSFTKSDWQKMNELRGVYLVCDKYGVLRHVATYVRAETGMGEIAFYERLLDEAVAAPVEWPTIYYTVQAAPELMAPPCSWKLLIDEVGRFVVEVLGVPDDDALAVALTVQHAMLPSVGRAFPLELDLRHDYTSWYLDVVRAKQTGFRDSWEQEVAALRTYAPSSFTVDDPGDVCRSKIGGSVDSLSMSLVGWELGSPVARSLMSSAHA
jgi:radical SAM superfamily enzyme YgiQ (UPF0313 family)